MINTLLVRAFCKVTLAQLIDVFSEINLFFHVVKVPALKRSMDTVSLEMEVKKIL